MGIDQAAAEGALAAHLGPLALGDRVIAAPVPGYPFWRAWRSNGDDPYVGADYLIGPDGRVWTVSSNGSIHDRQLTLDLLHATYQEQLEAHLDPVKFADRLAELTASLIAAQREFVADVRAGVLRYHPKRPLP